MAAEEALTRNLGPAPAVPSSSAQVARKRDRMLQMVEEGKGTEGKVVLAAPKETTVLIKAAEHKQHAAIRWLSLVLLMLQTSIGILMIKWSQRHRENTTPYLSTTAVVMAEAIKTAAAFLLVAHGEGGLLKGMGAVWGQAAEAPMEVLKSAVPSIVYCVHNNLTFYSLTKIGAPAQQTLFQLKILCTAGLGVLMLGRRLTLEKWSACILLTIGVIMVEWPGKGKLLTSGASGEHLKGVVSVLLSCVMSGFGSVWCQAMLQQTGISIWMRNVQFGVFGVLMGLVMAFGSDGHKIMQGGFFQGYTSFVWSVVIMMAFGGLLCGIMLKYAGATLGCFATASSIVLTGVLSWFIIGDVIINLAFCAGTLLVVTSILLFTLGLPDSVASYRCWPFASS